MCSGGDTLFYIFVFCVFVDLYICVHVEFMVSHQGHKKITCHIFINFIPYCIIMDYGKNILKIERKVVSGRQKKVYLHVYI